MNRRFWTLTRLASFSLAASLAGTAGAWQGSALVTITELQLLPGGTYSSAYGINDSGKIVGVANDSAGALHVVEWVNGQIAIVPDIVLGGQSVPQDVNDAGEIAGRQVISGFFSYALHWDAQNSPSFLPGLPGGGEFLNIANAINASGQIVGRAKEGGPSYSGHAVVWYQGALQADLGFMGGGIASEAFGINDAGTVVGAASVASGALHAFLWQNGQFTDLSTWSGGAVTSSARAINNHGDIVGMNASVAALWQNGAVQPLSMPAGLSAYTTAVDINDAGDIIATASAGYPFEFGVLWRNGTPIDLGTLPGGTISRARRINQAGVIVGEANGSSGFFRAVQWTVTTGPATYCSAKVNSLGCSPAIGWSGAPSAFGGSFHILTTQLLNQKNGLSFYGFGPLGAPFFGGTLCVAPPLHRLDVQNSLGSSSGDDCSGTMDYEFNGIIQGGGDPQLVVGQKVYCQTWARDPQDPFTVSLSNALSFEIGP